MADPRTFVLIGDFQDNITPSLEKINNSIANLKRTFAGLSTKRGGYGDVTKSIGSLVSAQKQLADSVKEVKSAVSESIPVLRQYKKEIGGVARAHFAIARATNQAARNEAQFWKEAQKSAENYARFANSLGTRRPTRAGGMSPMMGGGGGGGRPPRDYTPRARETYDREYQSRGSVARDATYAFGQTLGYQLSNVIVGSITQGFQIGVGLMTKPFEYFAGAIKERVADELSDIQAAGGLLAVSRRQKDPFVKSFQESMRFTQQTNARFAEIAAALPGNTQQYIEVGKRLSDTAARIVSSDTAKAIQEANALRAARGAEALTGPSRKQQQGAIQELLESMTTQTVLAGMGGGGAGRTMGPYGLPQLTERMIGEQEVTMSQFQRYAAIFRDPAMAQALERYIPEINKTQRNTVDRFKVLKRMYDEILPPEVIRAYERSLEGIKETYYTAFMNPETGLFGIGRKLKGVARNMNQFGQYIKTLEDGTEKVLTEAEIAAGQFEMVDMSVFDLFRDILANVGVVLGPIVNNLTLLFDPMKNVANALTKAREATARFLYSFEFYRQGLIDFAKTNLKTKEDKVNFAKIDVNFRASLAAINNLYKQLGIITGADFLKNAKQIESIEFDAAAMLKGFIDKFMDSKLAQTIGETVGTVVGTVITQMANMVSMFAGLAKPNKLVQGFMDGFNKAKGPEAIQAILKGVFEIITKALIEVFKLAPAQFTALGGAVLLIPAFMSGVSVAIGNYIEDSLDFAFDGLKKRLAKGGPKEILNKIDDVVKPGGPVPTRARPGSGGMIFDPYTPEAPAPVKPTRAERFKGFAKGAVGVGGEIESVFGKSFIEFLKKFQNFFAKVGPAISKATTALKGIGPKITASMAGFATLLNGLRDFITGDYVGSSKLANFVTSLKNLITKIDDFLIGVIEGSINIVDDIPGIGKIRSLGTTLKNLLTKVDDVIIGLLDGNINILDDIISGAKGLGAKGLAALKGAGAGAKGLGGAAKALPVRIMGVAKNVAAGAKGAAGGLGGLLTRGTKMLGKGGGILTAGVGIIEAITSLLSGDSLGTAIGKGAGPVLGTIIGTALLGPLGGFIGGWIGSMESITAPLGQAFDSVIQTLTVTFDFLGQIGSDLLGIANGLVRSLTGASEGFDLLKFALFAILSPFRLLELGIRGLYVLYLQMKANLGLASKDERDKLEKEKTDLAKRTAQFVIDGEEARGVSKSKQLEEAKAELARLETKRVELSKRQGGKRSGSYSAGPSQAEKDLQLRIKTLEEQTKSDKKEEKKNQPKPAEKKDAAKEVQATAQNTSELNKKAVQQVTAASATQRATEATKAATASTEKAVVAQKASLNTIQSTLSSIFALMASGGLRVQTQQQSQQNFYFNGQKPENFNNVIPGMDPTTGMWQGFQWRAKGGLGDAIASEMRMKPAGSDLVIANSSETVIPAAGGNGMMDFVETLRAGFGAMVTTYKEAQQKQDNTLRAIKDTLVSNQLQTNARLQKLETKFTAPGMAGGLGGASAGGVDAFTPIAQRYGLQMTSGYRPGDPGWHGANRARDFSNGTGPTPQMLQFAQFMASNYGSNLKELIYTPLGFSIKNGQRVPPYAQGSHYNHVHVAYALGLNNGRMFTSLDAARGWEESMVPGSVKVASITGNSAEGFGGQTTINNTFEITQQPGEDGEALANRVATLFYNAMNTAQSSAIFS